MADDAYTDDLRNILHLLRKPRLTKVDPIPSDERCCICLRDFNSLIDPTDEEPPCNPMQLHPCGHLVGDACYEKLPTRHQGRCLLCTRPVTYNTHAPKVLSVLCNMNMDCWGWACPLGLISEAPIVEFPRYHFQTASFFRPIRVVYTPNQLPKMQARLFDNEPYTIREALELGIEHLHLVAEFLIRYAFALLLTYCLRKIVLMYILASYLPLPDPLALFFACLTGSCIGFAAGVLFIGYNNRDFARFVPLAARVCLVGVECVLTTAVTEVNANYGFPVAACTLMIPFALYFYLYALVTGWLIYLAWRHHA